MEHGYGAVGKPVSEGRAVCAGSALDPAATGAYVLASPAAEKGSRREGRVGPNGDSSSGSHRSSR